VKVWIVRAGDGATVGDILRRAREDLSAIAAGWVFVGKKRVTSATQAVRIGDEVRIGKPGPKEAPAEVLWTCAGLVACVKPAGIPTVPDHAGAAHALVARVSKALGVRGEALRVTSRLDREVSGVVIFAQTEEAEARLKAARAEGRYERRYVAIAKGELPAESGTWDAPIGRAPNPLLRAVNGIDAKESETRWRVVARTHAFLLLAVAPITGRTHQIRVHSAYAGVPLLGDRDYGGPTRATLASGSVVSLSRIVLHAARVAVPDGTGAVLEAIAPIPEDLRRPWAELGGEPEAWDTAVACALA